MNFKEVYEFASYDEAKERLSLGSDGVQILLVDTHAGDIDGCECISRLRGASENRCIPIVMVTSECEYEFVLSAIGAGCSGYVIRPYSINTLENHIKIAWKSSQKDEIEFEQLSNAQEMISQGLFDEAIEELDEILDSADESQMYFDKGMSYLQKQKYGKAILSFTKAVKLNNMYAEAFKGLAEAHKGKGNNEEYTKYMKQAADVLAQQDRLDDLKTIFIEILKEDPNAVNPYNSLGLKLRRDGNVEGAIDAYLKALQLTPNDEHLHYNIAKAYIFFENYVEGISHLERSTLLNPNFEPAVTLLEKTRRYYKKIKQSSDDLSDFVLDEYL